jgi:CBS domain-containing protein
MGDRADFGSQPYRTFLEAGENEMNVATILKHKGGDVFTTTSDKSLLEIAKLLRQHGVGCIVIVGNDDKIAGIVSERDFRHMPVVEKDRLIGLVSIGDLVKIQISEIDMEAAATREYTA